VATRRENHVTLSCRLTPLIGVDHPAALNDDEEFVGLMVTVTVMAGPGREHRPSQEEVLRACGVLVDEKLDLHVHPTLIPIETGNEGDIVESRAVRLHQDIPLSR
jgi:hypothetical protein